MTVFFFAGATLMISTTDPYEIRIPQFNLEVREVGMTKGKRTMLLRPLKTEIRWHRGESKLMTLYETFNFARGEVVYWAVGIPNE